MKEKTVYVSEDGMVFDTPESARTQDSFIQFMQLLDDAVPNHIFIGSIEPNGIRERRAGLFEVLWRHRDHLVSALKDATAPTDTERMSS